MNRSTDPLEQKQFNACGLVRAKEGEFRQFWSYTEVPSLRLGAVVQEPNVWRIVSTREALPTADPDTNRYSE